MSRLSLALVVIWSAVMATVAAAQSYPMYGAGPMPPGAYNAGMPPGGMYPSMPPGGGYPGMMPPGGAQRGMMPPQGMYPAMQAGGFQPGMPSQGGYPPQGMNPGGPGGNGRTAIPGGPQMKLPPGVKAENGVLYYDGNAYAEPGQQMNPYQMAAYQAGVQSAMGPGAMAGGMAQQAGFHGPMHGHRGMYGPPPGYCGPNPGPGCPDGGPSDAYDCDVYGRPRKKANFFPGKYGYVWSASVDALGMSRDSDTDRVFVLNTNTLEPLFNSGELDFEWEIGGRARVKLIGPSGIGYEAVYMKLATLFADAEVEGNNDLQIPFPLAAFTIDYFGADTMQFHYTSSIQSGEANVIYPFGNFQFVFGYRYVEINESLRLRSDDDIDGGTSDYTTDCFNSMHGGQIGLLGQWEAFGLINFDFAAKFGVFGDLASQRQVIRDLDNTLIIRDTSGEENDVAYVSELEVVGVLPLGPHFSIHAGYNVMFINKVALAPNQLDFTNTASSGTRVQQKGDIILHGAVVGLTAVW